MDEQRAEATPFVRDVTSLPAMIRGGISKDPDAPLVFWSDGRETATTARDIWDQAGVLAEKLKQLGFAPGDAVAIQVPNNRDGIIAMLACCRLALVIVPLVMSYAARELEFILRQARAKAFITRRTIKDIDAVERLASFGEMADLRHIVVIGDGRGSDPRVIPFEDLLRGTCATFSQDIPQVDPDDVFAIVYTSGTTGGEPKGAIHTHASFGYELAVDADVWIPDGAQRAPLVIFPPGHIAGFAYSLMPIIDGSGAVYMDAWNAEAAAALVGRHRLAWTFGTPFHLTTLLEAAAPGQLQSLRMFGCGGASVPPSLIERADAEGVKAFRAYGSTEHPSISSGRLDDPLRIRAYTDGTPMPGVEVRILEDDGGPCAAGQVGEIVSSGPELFHGYLDPKHNAGVLHDGWYRTGDLGRLDEDGALTIVDRKKDIVIRAGENISSKEVEDAILQIDGVLAVAVVGWPDERYGERVAAFVQTREGFQFELGAVAEHFAAQRMARFKTPERLVLVDDFERSAAGKILKVPLRAQAARLAASESNGQTG